MGNLDKKQLKARLKYFQQEFSIAKKCIEEGKPNTFFVTVPPRKGKDGVIIAGFAEYSDLMNGFWRLMLENYIALPPKGYLSSPFPEKEPSRPWIAVADLDEVKIFLFTFYRAEKFTLGGCWADCIEDGRFLYITKRLLELIKEEIGNKNCKKE